MDGPAPPELTARQRRLLVPTLIFVGLLVAIVSSLGAPLIPTVAATYHVTLGTAQWVLTAALLTGALATPIMGRLADGVRQRDVIVIALSAVCLGCVLSALAPTFVLLVVGRGFQGLGLGLLPVNMAIARRSLDRTASTRAIATLSASTAIGAGIGYPLTALVAQLFDFRAAYWFGAVVVLGSLLCSLAVLPGRTPGKAPPFDVLGAVLLSVAVIATSVALSEGGGWGWTSPRTLTLAALAVVVLVAWVAVERRLDLPLVDLRHLANRSVLTADLSGFLICVAMYLFIPIVVEFVQVPPSFGYGFGASILVSGLVLVPLSVGTFLSSRFLAAYEHRVGARSVIPLGSLLFASASLFFAWQHTALWQAFAAVGLAGLGVGFTFAAMPGFIIRAVPHEETGSATGFYQVLRNIGLSVGSALGAAVLSAHTAHGSVLPELSGFRVVLLVSAGLTITTALVSFVLPGRPAAVGEAVPVG